MSAFLVSGVTLLTACLSMQPPEFWSQIANDSGNAPELRQFCLEQLARRHFHAGMKLTEFARLLNRPTWIENEYFCKLNDVTLGGWIPMDVDVIDNKTSTFSFTFMGGRESRRHLSVYFKTPGNLKRDAVLNLLRGQHDDRLKDVLIEQVVVYPPIDQDDYGPLTSQELPPLTIH